MSLVQGSQNLGLGSAGTVILTAVVAIIGLVQVLLIFLFLQRYLVQGVGQSGID